MIKEVIKRDGVTHVTFNKNKIQAALEKANDSVQEADRISAMDIGSLIYSIEVDLEDREEVGVEEIQDQIEIRLMNARKYNLARNYITYRYKRDLVRRQNTTDKSILSLLKGKNKEVQNENSNKKAMVNSTQRDLIAGETSKDVSRRILLPQHIIEAHDKGILHFHDMDYFMQPEFNCCLPNFRDMLENGTTIHGVSIDPPKTFRVACNQITQAMADIASNQYGGQTCYLDVLGRYLALTRTKFEKRIRKKVESYGVHMSNEERDSLIKDMVDEELQLELEAGVQTIQYQINTLMTTNGQAPFVTLFMYLKEDDPYIEENAMIFEEVLKQRLKGFKNKQGVYITPAFPKLVYVLGKNNCLQGGKYDYITHLAAKCTAKRMYPDYISEKVMMENYDGEVFGCMGCVKGNETIWWRNANNDQEPHKSAFSDFWKIMRWKFGENRLLEKENSPYFIDTKENIDVWDTKEGWVPCRRIMRNVSSQWVEITLENGKVFTCTEDHLLPKDSGRIVEARYLLQGDKLLLPIDPDNFTGSLRDTEWVPITNVNCYRGYDYSYDVTTMSNYFEVSDIYTHNCRSFLSAYRDPTSGELQWEGRFNQGVVTLNLPSIALDANKDEDLFWKLFEERLSLCYEALMCRHKALEGTLTDTSPIHWQDGAIARMQPGETIDKLLHNNYSSISLGYIGLYECTKHMTGFSHTSKEGREFSLRVMNRLRDATDSWKKATGIGFSLYGTPAESACYTLCKKDRERFGIVEDVTDKDWYTNSYHIDVREPIDALTKLDLESIYQKISAGGALSYVEIPNMCHNIEAIEAVIKFIYEKVQYGEFNTKSDYCSKCGFEGEIVLDEQNEWMCPNCGNKDTNTMNITRRTCGYLGTGEAGWNEGKTAEIGQRVVHLF